MVQMRENMFLEKQKSLEDLRSTLEREKREALARAEEKIMHQVKSQSNAIKVRYFHSLIMFILLYTVYM